jgi:hypothetical protein
VDFGQNGFAIGFAFTVKKLLVGAERRHPALNLLAEFVAERRRGASYLDDLDGPFHSFDVIDRGEFNPGFGPRFSLRRFAGDRLNKRQGLRDEKIALLCPFHHLDLGPGAFQQKAPPRSSRAFGQARFLLCRHENSGLKELALLLRCANAQADDALSRLQDTKEPVHRNLRFSLCHQAVLAF